MKLPQAGKMGFEKFADNIGTHLKKALIEWLTGSLPGVYIPQKLDIKEILKFVLSVLGLTWANIRVKLVKAIGETAVKVLETSFKLVVTLVTDARLARSHPDARVRACASVVLAANLGTAALIFTFTPFVTQIGLQFWFLAGALHGLVAGRTARAS